MSKSLNIRVYNASVHDRKLFHEAGVKNAWFIPDSGLLPSFAQAFSTCEGDKKRPIMLFHALPYWRHFGLKGLPVLRIARPILADEEWDPLMVNVLLESVRVLARRVSIVMAEIEIYSEIKAPIFFPSSSSAVDNCNDPLLNTILIKKGLQLAKVNRTFQVKKSLHFNSLELSDNLEIRPIRSNNCNDRQTYYKLWSESGLLPVYLPKRQKANWLSLRPWYGDVCSLLNIEENIFFAELKGTPVGFVHWVPNLYKILTDFGRNSLYSSAVKGKDLIKATGEAKIFKLAVSKKVGKYSGVIKKILLLHAMKTMFMEFSINVCHVSCINQKEPELSSILKELEAEVVQEISLFTSRM